MPTDDPITSAIESAVATLPKDDAPTAVADPPPPADAPPPVESADPAPVKTPEQTEEEELTALEADVVKKTPGIQNGKMSTSRHQAVLTRQRNLWEKQQAAAIDEAKKAYAQYEAAEFKERVKVAELAEGDFDTFFSYVSEHPKHKAAVERVIAERVKAHVPPPPPAPRADDPFKDVPAEEPQPDMVNPDGSLGYSAKAQRDYVKWQAAQMTSDLRRQMEEDRKKLAPLMTERETREAQSTALKTMGERITEARRSWPDFAGLEAQIAEYIHAPGNEKATLEGAYRAVYAQAMQAKLAAATADRDKMAIEIEASIIKRMNDGVKPTTPRVPPGAPPITPKADPDADPTETTIRNAMRAAGL